jgi:hypothetical protein
MRIKKVLGMTRQYELHDGRIVSFEDFKAGRVPENKPVFQAQVIERLPMHGKKKNNRW